MQAVLRPTITDGTIIIRDKPETSLAGLNRDIEKAREITKNEKINVDVYIDPAAIEEVASGFEGIREQGNAYVDFGKYLAEKAKLALDKDLPKEQHGIASAMLQGGATLDQAKDLLERQGKNGGLSLGQALNELQKISDGSSVSIYPAGSKNDSTHGLFHPNGIGGATLSALARIHGIVETFTPEERAWVSRGVNVVTGGPVKAVISEGISLVAQQLETGIGEAVSGAIQYAAEGIAGIIFGALYDTNWDDREYKYYSDEEVQQRKEDLRNGAAFGLQELFGAAIAGIAKKVTGTPGKGEHHTITNSKGEMLGKDGPILPSKSVWYGDKGARLDVENGAPGSRAGQIHYQNKTTGEKYLYDPVTNSFQGAPPRVNKLLENPGFSNGIAKAMKYLGEK